MIFFTDCKHEYMNSSPTYRLSAANEMNLGKVYWICRKPGPFPTSTTHAALKNPCTGWYVIFVVGKFNWARGRLQYDKTTVFLDPLSELYISLAWILCAYIGRTQGLLAKWRRACPGYTNRTIFFEGQNSEYRNDFPQRTCAPDHDVACKYIALSTLSTPLWPK